MNEQASPSAWQDEETARHYQLFSQKTTMYQDLSAVMVNLAQLKPGMTILDLGCGTGVTTQAILNGLGYNGHVFAADVSAAMLAVARENIASPQVTFIEADAANIAPHFEEPVDRILCNSVFWQLRDKTAVMAQLRQILADDGRFIFNIPEPYFIPQDIPRSKKAAVLFKQLAAERYGVGPQDLRTIKVFLERHGFNLVQTQPFERIRTAEESYLFMQLPVATAWMEPPLDYQTRMALLNEAQEMADPTAKSKRRWMYFVVEKASIP